MKDSLLLDSLINDDTKSSIDRVLAANTVSFGKLIAVANLDPERHLRHSDLRDVDFTDTDLTGYDLTGCDLRGAHGIRVTWSPETTNFTDALVDDSLFAHRLELRAVLQNDDVRTLHRLVRIMRWEDQIVWATKNLRRGAPNLEQNKIIAKIIFEGSKDSFVKGEMLKLLEKTSDNDERELRDMMLDIINGSSQDRHLIGKTIKILLGSRRRNDPRALEAIESLLQSQDNRIVALAVDAIVSAGSDKATIRQVAHFALQRSEQPLRYAFISALVRRLGPHFDLIVRNPITEDLRDENEQISEHEIMLMARNIIRGYYEDQERLHGGRNEKPSMYTAVFGNSIEQGTLLNKFNEMFEVLASFGMKERRMPTFLVLPAPNESDLRVLRRLDRRYNSHNAATALELLLRTAAEEDLI